MSELTAAFERYCQALETIGVKTHHRLAPPATTSEIDRLAERLDTELPDQLREWFSIFNGLDPSAEPRSARELVPMHVPRSVQETIDAIDRWEIEFKEFHDDIARGGDGDLLVMKNAPILIDSEGSWDGTLMMDCGDVPGRMVTYSLEDFDDQTGYYHDSLLDMINGSTKNIENGYCAERFHSVYFNEARLATLEPKAATRAVRLTWYGFDAEGPTPSRLGGREHGSWTMLT